MTRKYRYRNDGRGGFVVIPDFWDWAKFVLLALAGLAALALTAWGSWEFEMWKTRQKASIYAEELEKHPRKP